MSDMTINLTPNLYQYLQNNSLRMPPVMVELRNKTNQVNESNMQISPEQAQFMQLLIEMLNAKKTLDIGVFTGYSSLAVALALPKDGTVIACDINDEWTAIAKEYWMKAGVYDKIDLKIGPAADSLQQLIDNGEDETFDFAFIDADKAGYDKYYELSLQLLRKGGIIAIDNVLWKGKVADPEANDRSTVCLRELNAKLHHDERISLSMIPIGDGLTLARKR